MDQVQNKVNFKIEKKNYTKGHIVIIEGSNKKELYTLNSGSIEIKKSSGNIQNLDEREIIAGSKKIGTVESSSVFGMDNIFNSNSQDCSYIANTDCEITKYNIQADDFSGFLRSNSSKAETNNSAEV